MLNTTQERTDILRLLALGILVILEGLAVVSTVLNITLLPLGPIYPNVD